MADKKRTATPADASKRTTTKPEATDVVLPVTDPVDLWYLCEKITYAKLNPFKRSDSIVMYQRVVTQLVRRDCEFFNYTFPYAGEVGFDMTQAPPAPIMSMRQPHRPSTFPLSQYRVIKEGYFRNPFAPWLVVDKELLSLGELEQGLTPGARARSPSPFPGGRGMIRIPDVIRMINFALSGKPQFSQPNIHNVIEIKFEGDFLSLDQIRSYRTIAGSRDNFRLLRTSMCDGSKRRTRDWVRTAKTEPVYMPASKATERAARRRNSMAIVPEHELLVDAIDKEHEEVRREITPRPVDPNTTYVKASPSPEVIARSERERRRVADGIAMVLAAPFAAAAAGTAVIGAPIVLGGPVEEVVTAETGAEIIQFPRVLRPTGPAAAAAVTTAAEKLAAQPLDRPGQQETVYALPTTYVYWPD